MPKSEGGEDSIYRRVAKFLIIIGEDEAAKDQLLNWLNFWKPGEHDDRTIAILY